MTEEYDPLAVLRRIAEQEERDTRFWEVLGMVVTVAAIFAVFGLLTYLLVKA